MATFTHNITTDVEINIQEGFQNYLKFVDHIVIIWPTEITVSI